MISLLHNTASDLVSVEILPDSNPSELADAQCPSEFDYCKPLLTHSAELYQYKQYNKPLTSWGYNEICNSMFPPQTNATKLKVIQYLHIPKTGTSFNFFLHSYFDNCSTDETHPCPNWLTNVRYYLYSSIPLISSYLILYLCMHVRSQISSGDCVTDDYSHVMGTTVRQQLTLIH